MATFTIQATESIYTGNAALANVSVGDTILTSGFYATGDGGAAKFIVQTGTADNYFSHAINGCPGLIASLVLEDGVVNVDQLGAKGDAVLPASYDNPVSTKEDCDARTNLTIAANVNATGNEGVFTAACTSESVQEIRWTSGKYYGIRGNIQIAGNHKLDGCGAVIINLKTQSEAKMLQCQGTTDNFAENVEIYNLRLIGNYRFLNDNGPSVKGVWIQRGKNIQVHHVEVERCSFGIHVTMPEAEIGSGNMNQVDIDHVNIHDVRIGIQYNIVQNAKITDSIISADYTFFLSAGNKDHCIYADHTIRHCIFERLILKNANGGSAINIKGDWQSENLIIRQIISDNCGKAIGFHHTKNATVEAVMATNVTDTGINFANAQNISIDGCRFSGNASYTGGSGFSIAADTYNGVQFLNESVQNISICNCCFDFPWRFFVISQNRYGNCSGIRVSHCRFSVSSPQTSQKDVPAYIKGIVSDIRFYRCRFETGGFESNDDSMVGVFFYFSSALAQGDDIQDYIMHWFFDKCEFINNGTTSVNSPILSQTNDISNTVYCSVRNCLLHGFRWIIRVAHTDLTLDSAIQKRVDDYYINPCTLGHDEALEGLAISKLNLRKRFLSYHNIYHVANASGSSEIIRVAEEYGY